MAALVIHAGERAKARLLDEGIHEDMFDALVGASGGPKWFVLYGLDRYLFGEFFVGRQRVLNTLGSSAGAWRMSCLACPDPAAAIERLADLYSHERYSERPTPGEVSAQASVMLANVLGEDGVQAVSSNPVFKTHIIANRGRQLGPNSSRLVQGLVLASAATLNAISRKALSCFFERTIFCPDPQQSPWRELDDLRSVSIALTPDNLQQSLLASGSIPFVLEGVANIPGSKEGLYWDGGITDYHFDLPFDQLDGLVLYPHFQATVKPGWFDKRLPWRRAAMPNFNNVVLLRPSAEFVSTLPGGKLSDRSDFARLKYAERVTVFREVLERSKQLADELRELVEKGIEPAQIRPIV